MPSHRPVTACTRPSSGARRTPGPRAGRTTAAVLAAGASLALLAGCASATDGAGTAAAANAAVSPAAATSATTPSVSALAARVAAAVGAATSVHVASDLSSVGSLPVTLGALAGDVALHSGTPTAASVTAGGFALRYVGGTTWVTLPGSPAATPWTLVSPTSSNPIVAAAATRLGDLRTKLTGLDAGALLGAATGLRLVGPGDVDGTAATQYAFTVDPKALTAALGTNLPTGATTAGPVPVQVWLDAADRPLQVTATPTVQGATHPVTVTLSRWNAPVSITAPDPSQVAR